MMNIRLKSKKTAAAAVIIAVIAIFIAVLLSLHSVGNETATCDEVGEYSLKADSAEELTEFLSQFDITADSQSIDEKKITIPSEFNSIYEKYNLLQKSIGLDLRPYQGKEVSLYTVKIINGERSYAAILVYDGRVIGAHLTNGVYGEENLPLV